MAGGLLNLISEGSINVFLTGNPSKTFFKSTYRKYTNFGLQKFRIDFRGQRALRLTEDSIFTFKMPRYADLLMGTFMCITLPHIWSPLHADHCYPYKFKWIRNIGTQMIKQVRFLAGSQLIQQFSGSYLNSLVDRDFNGTKKVLYNNMTGNLPGLYDPLLPVSSAPEQTQYPSAVPSGTQETYNALGAAPSIPSRKVYVPLNVWFTLAAKMAYPLVSTQYCELEIEITLRPINELFTIQRCPDGVDYDSCQSCSPTTPLADLAPNFSLSDQSMKLFLQPPPWVPGPSGPVPNPKPEEYLSEATSWDADLHLVSTYAFLSKDEVTQFAAKPQQYMTTQVHEVTFNDVISSAKLRLYSLGMVKSYLWFLRRSDSKLRNQWSNYTNMGYEGQPRLLLKSTAASMQCPSCEQVCTASYSSTGMYNSSQQSEIMTTWGLDLAGKPREEPFESGVFRYIEEYARSNGTGKAGLYSYNFCLHTSPYDFQPSGGINMSKFNRIEMIVGTISPPLADVVGTKTICTPEGEPIGTIKPVANIYEWSYDMVIFEERYNILAIENGMAGLKYAR